MTPETGEVKSLLRRHARRIAGVTGAAVLLTGLAMVLTGGPSTPSLTQTSLTLIPPSVPPTPTPTAAVLSTLPPIPSAPPFENLDAEPKSATIDQVNTAIGLAIGAILLALVAAGLAGVAIARQPADGDESPPDQKTDDQSGN